MTIADVKALIANTPADIDIDTRSIFNGGGGRELADAAERVLGLFVEAEQYELTDAEQKVLREHLIQAGRQMNVLMEMDDQYGRRNKGQQRKAQRNLSLHAAIAEKLGISPQELQIAGSNDPIRVPIRPVWLIS